MLNSDNDLQQQGTTVIQTTKPVRTDSDVPKKYQFYKYCNFKDKTSYTLSDELRPLLFYMATEEYYPKL